MHVGRNPGETGRRMQRAVLRCHFDQVTLLDAHFAAVCGLISTHVPHITLESGSGASCIQGNCASEPS